MNAIEDIQFVRKVLKLAAQTFRDLPAAIPEFTEECAIIADGIDGARSKAAGIEGYIASLEKSLAEANAQH